MKFQDYLNLKAQIKDAVELEMRTRKEIINNTIGYLNGEGTKKAVDGDWSIKAVLKKGYKFKKNAVKFAENFDPRSFLKLNDEYHDFNPTGEEALTVASNLEIPAKLFNISISVSVAEYRKLNVEQKRFMDQFIEIKQEAPTLTITHEGQDDN